MGNISFLAALPLLLLSATAMVALLSLAVYRSHRLIVVITLLGLLLTFLSLPIASSEAPSEITRLLLVDQYALFFTGLLTASAFVLTLFAYDYWHKREGMHEEFYLLLLLATLGAVILASSMHFASFFLGLEILSTSLYALVGYQRGHRPGIEAAIKYLVLAGISSAFILFGMALIYTDFGAMQFREIALIIHQRAVALGPLALAGLGMILVGVGFKLALFPFHLWTPDVYQGAPAPVTAFIASISKGGVFALLVRLFLAFELFSQHPLQVIVSLLAILSMFAGNLLALRQENIKRLLAYSSIANMGYLLVALLAGGARGITAIAYYLCAYLITVLAAFGVVMVLSTGEREAETFEDYRALAWRRPWLAVILTAALLSLAGLPLTAGFVGKFFILAAGVSAGQWPLVIILVLNSGIGLYYYLRLVTTMFRSPEETAPAQPPLPSTPVFGGVALAMLLLALLWLGVYPSSLLGMIQEVIRGL